MFLPLRLCCLTVFWRYSLWFLDSSQSGSLRTPRAPTPIETSSTRNPLRRRWWPLPRPKDQRGCRTARSSTPPWETSTSNSSLWSKSSHQITLHSLFGPAVIVKLYFEWTVSHINMLLWGSITSKKNVFTRSIYFWTIECMYACACPVLSIYWFPSDVPKRWKISVCTAGMATSMDTYSIESLR